MHRDRVLDERDRFVRAAAQLEAPSDDLTGAAIDDRVQVGPAVLGDPDARHVEVPELVRPLDAEEAGTPPAAERLMASQEPLLPHHTLRPFPVDLPPKPLTRERGDHPRPVARVRVRDVDDQPINRSTTGARSTAGRRFGFR